MEPNLGVFFILIIPTYRLFKTVPT